MRATLRRCAGVGLDDVLRGDVSVDEAWDLLMHAPRDSPLTAAIADDPEFAQPGAKVRAPRLTEFSPEVEVLASVHDLLGSLLSVVVSLGGGKPPKVTPYRRPVTAGQVAERAQARREHRELVYRLTGEEA